MANDSAIPSPSYKQCFIDRALTGFPVNTSPRSRNRYVIEDVLPLRF